MPTAFGFYGKIPSHGDFLRRDLSPAFIEPWDTWLQQSLLTGRDVLADRWQNAYFSAPIWRFALPAGLCGPDGMMGVLMPSVDRVGRQFPLTIATPIGDADPWGVFRANDAVYRALEDAALAMLEDGAEPAQLESVLAGIAVAVDSNGTHLKPCGRGLCMSSTASPGTVLAAAHLSTRFSKPSLWGCVIEDQNHFFACPGMPTGADEIRPLMDLGAPAWTGGDILETLL
ncbi:MAG: type VI secretion system-associated protein TagF [Pseudomonadota bacterium]